MDSNQTRSLQMDNIAAIPLSPGPDYQLHTTLAHDVLSPDMVSPAQSARADLSQDNQETRPDPCAFNDVSAIALGLTSGQSIYNGKSMGEAILSKRTLNATDGPQPCQPMTSDELVVKSPYFAITAKSPTVRVRKKKLIMILTENFQFRHIGQ
jgi:hypothetical protein